jgi:hypothetical protein
MVKSLSGKVGRMGVCVGKGQWETYQEMSLIASWAVVGVVERRGNASRIVRMAFMLRL